jgi:hypothetical protein
MSANLKRLQKIEAALEQLLAKQKVYLVVYRGNDLDAEIQWYIDVGEYDPDKHEAVLISAWGPRPREDPKTYKENKNKPWKDLPQIWKPSQADLIREEINEMHRIDAPAGPVPEPKPEPRRRIKYPDMGIV